MQNRRKKPNQTESPGNLFEFKTEQNAAVRPQIPFYSMPPARLSEIFGVKVTVGLPTDEAGRRQQTIGKNSLEFERRQKWWHLLLSQFSSIVILLLAVAALISFLTGNHLEASAILVVLAINAVIGFLIEWQAGRALDALKKATRTTARVRRDGREQIIDAENLVPGDVLILTAGDRVSADVRIFESSNLRADESTLTGESQSIMKTSSEVAENAALAERHSMLFLGTSVVAGHALCIVTAIGPDTEIGRIGQLVAAAGTEITPLEKRLADLGKKLVYIVLFIAAAVFAAGILRGESLWEMFEVAISLAVAAVPEGLPAVTTLILALGVLRMARRNAIVRRLSAVETLGSTTVICTDKTGTLTENRMTVVEYRLADDRLIKFFENDGFNPVVETESYKTSEILRRFLLVNVFCNEATLDSKGEGDSRFIGDPTETALLSAAEKIGFKIEDEKTAYEKLSELPFDSVSKKMTTVLRDRRANTNFALVKGAPSVILDSCGTYISRTGKILPLTAEKLREFMEINETMADAALRVLAFADKSLPGDWQPHTGGLLENGFTFLGLAGMSDPPRAGAAEAVRLAQNAGIRVVMLTGDQIRTARAIARRLKIAENNFVNAIHSSELAQADSENLARMACRAHVFARVTPEDKMRIVKALRETGEIVAVTGDGVNDAPALKYSNIGVAMGMRGTEVAKEASDIVLTDDNFATIVGAIEGGRTIYANIVKFVHLLFSDNLGEVLVIFVAIMLGLPLPLLPLQILWVNLVTDVFPALSLAVEPSSPDTMRRKPHSPGETLLSKGFLILIFWKGLFSSAIVLGSYYWALQNYGEGAHARTIALLTLVGVQTANLFNCRSRTRSAFSRFFGNPYVFLAFGMTIFLQILAVYFQPLATVLNTVPLSNADFLVIGLSVILPLIIVELEKAVCRRYEKKKERLTFFEIL